MIFVRYDRNRLIFAAMAMLGLALASSAGAGASGDLIADTIATLMFVVFVSAASRLGYLASGDLAALEDDGDALIVTGFWRSRRIPWRSFAGISVRSVKLRWLFLPFLSFDHLIVRRGDTGMFGGQTKLPLLLADLPRGRISKISEQLDALALERGRGSIDAPGPSATGGFDPDAAIARYLARKQEAEPEAAAPASPAWSASAARPQAPVRAGFGRKGL